MDSVKKLEKLLAISKSIMSEMNLDELLVIIMNTVTTVMEADRSTLFLIDKASNELRSKVAQGVGTGEIRVPIGVGIAGTVAKNGRTINIRDAYQDKRFNPEIDRKTGYHTKNILTFAMKNMAKEIIGVIQILNKKGRAGYFTKTDEDLLKAFSSLAAISIENARMYKELGELNRDLETKVEARTRELNEALKIQYELNNQLIASADILEKERIKLKNRNEIMEAEEEMARRIQMQFIPFKSPSPSIATFYKPMDKVGGDFFDFIKFDNSDLIGIFLNDVSGHGVPAAFITSMIKSILLQIASYINSPAFILEHLNEALFNQTGGNFVTAFYGIYNRKTRELHFANAGHNLPYLIKDDQVSFLPSSKTSVPLIVATNEDLKFMNKSYANESVILDANSKILFYTDGLTETVNVFDKEENVETPEFEEGSLQEALLELKSLPVDQFILGMYEKLKEYRGTDNFEDDVCMICMEIN